MLWLFLLSTLDLDVFCKILICDRLFRWLLNSLLDDQPLCKSFNNVRD